MCVCIYINIYIYIYIHIYMCVYTTGYIYIYIYILNADVFSHASGRAVGGVVEQQGCPDLIVAGTFLVLCFHK